jgi:predicted DNA binding CopG/RHH family protein
MMREEYDFSDGKKNPYAKELKKQVTIKISPSVIDYFKAQAIKLDIPYQTLINMYLMDCVKNKKELQMTWK